MSDGAAGTKSRDDVDHLGQLLVGGACHYGMLAMHLDAIGALRREGHGNRHEFLILFGNGSRFQRDFIVGAVHRTAREHKEMIRSYLRGLASDTGARNPVVLAEQLYILLEGAITAAQLHREPWPADYAGQAAQQLVKAARSW